MVMLEGEDLGKLFLTTSGNFQEGLDQSTQNRRACMRNLTTVEEAKEVCRDRSKWKEVISVYPKGKWA
jgi:hypothetical protein